MKLTAAELTYLRSHGVYVTEKCDGCGKLLNRTVRYTIAGKPAVTARPLAETSRSLVIATKPKSTRAGEVCLLWLLAGREEARCIVLRRCVSKTYEPDCEASARRETRKIADTRSIKRTTYGGKNRQLVRWGGLPAGLGPNSGA